MGKKDNDTILRIAQAVAEELKKQKICKNTDKTPYQKTEAILYSYHGLKQAVKDKLEQIEQIEIEGLPGKSKSIVAFSASKCNKDYDDIKKEKIDSIRQSMVITQSFVKTIDDILNQLKDDKYYKIIELKYFYRKSEIYIAEYIQCDASTISSNKKRLINFIQIRLFSDESILQIINS